VDGPSVYGYAGGRPQMAVDLDGRQSPMSIPAFGAGTAICGPVCGVGAAATVNLVGAITYICLRPGWKQDCQEQYLKDKKFCARFSGFTFIECNRWADLNLQRCLNKTGRLPWDDSDPGAN
jgi:hypothetical protein